MKCIRVIKSQTFIRLSLIIISIFPLSALAQGGENDVTFNKPDHIAAQGANGTVEVSAVQADNKIIIAGSFNRYNGVTVNKLARLKTDGSIDKSFNAGTGPDGKINTIAIQPNNKILIAGLFTYFNGVRGHGIIRLNSNGSIDTTFHLFWKDYRSTSQFIVLPDQKILVAKGEELLRLNKDGSIDNSFMAKMDSITSVLRIARQPDGKIIVGGMQPSKMLGKFMGIIRLNADGSRDYSFNRYIITYGEVIPYLNSLLVENDGNILLSSTLNPDRRAYYGNIRRLDSHGNELKFLSFLCNSSLLLQNDGKIIATGFKYMAHDLTWYNLTRKIVRLNKDLTIDSSLLFDDKKIYFNVADASFLTSQLQEDGKIIVGGHFFETGGLITNNMARINTNGSVDGTFNLKKGSNGIVLAVAVQGDEKILIGGGFSKYNLQPSANIARLKKNGQLDASFHTGNGTNGRVHAIAVQPNGKILIGGNFTSYNGHSCNNIARLEKNGDFDESFSGASVDNTVRKIALDRNGKIIITGDFTVVNSVSQLVIARILPTGQLDSTFHFSIQPPSWISFFYGYDFALSSRGQIYLAINYKSWLYQPRGTDVFRLNRNGTIDSTFKIPVKTFNEIYGVALNNDGKPVIGGQSFQSSSGIVAQLNTDGSLDSSFSHYSTGIVRTVNILENDKILIGGDFNSHIALLNRDGSTDTGFIQNADNSVYAATRATDNKLIIGGIFAEYSSAVRNGIARINIDIPDNRIRAEALFSSVETEDTNFNIFPNPAILTIQVDQVEPGSCLKIYSSIGKEMHAEISRNKNLAIDISSYSNGIYFLVVEKGDKRINKKFIVTR